MKQIIFLALFLAMPATNFAMKEEIITNKHALDLCEPIECDDPSINIKDNTVVYLGESELRQTLEKIYGQEFPINAIFYKVAFKQYKKLNIKPKPKFIPYSLIKDKKENQIISLKLNGKKYNFFCKQHAEDSYHKSRFEDLVAKFYKTFLFHPHCFLEDKESLAQQKVIKVTQLSKDMYFTEHGENGIQKITH